MLITQKQELASCFCFNSRVILNILENNHPIQELKDFHEGST